MNVAFLRPLSLLALLGSLVCAAGAAVRYRIDYSLTGVPAGSFPNSVTVKTATFIASDREFGAGQIEGSNLNSSVFQNLDFFPAGGIVPADTIGVTFLFFGLRPETFYAEFAPGSFQAYGTYTSARSDARLTVSNVAGAVPGPEAAIPFALMALRHRKRA